MQHIDPTSDSAADPEQLRRAVDAALAALSIRDRDAVMLRFFDAQGFAAIGEKIGVSEDAARMRVDRALTRLRERLEHKGIRTSAALLTTAIAEAGTGNVPPGLATQITHSALGSATSPSFLLLPRWGIVSTVAGTLLITAGALALSESSAEALRQTRIRYEITRARVEHVEKELYNVRAVVGAAEEDNARLRGAIASSSFAAIVNPATNRIAFVIDTSGSMRDPKDGNLHSIITDTLNETLARRPQAKEFHLLDTDGRAIASVSGEAWLKNDVTGRTAAIETLRAYRQDSMSNPVPGIERALILLDSLRDPRFSLEIIVLGDEHIGRRDAAIAQLERLNPVDASGQRQVTISAVAFPTWLGTANAERWEREKPATHLAYERLMRDVTGRHGGSFTAETSLSRQ